LIAIKALLPFRAHPRRSSHRRCPGVRLGEELDMDAPENSITTLHSCVPLDERFYADRQRFRAALSIEHPLAVLADEHTHVLGELSRLELALASAHPSADDLRVCAEVSAFLLQVEPHHLREERVLFPALRERGIDGPPTVMEAEHVAIRRAKERLRAAAVELLARSKPPPRAWEELCCAAVPLIAALRGHIAKEDAILYPLAQRAIEPSAWGDLRKRCDAIGYCCQRPPSRSR
jgi:DUF438 domain-containing protein